MSEDFEIKIPPYYDRIIYPLEKSFRPTMIVTNTSAKNLTLEFRHVTSLPWHVYLYPQGVPPFPKGNRLYLAPGESSIVHVLVPISNIEPGEQTYSSDIEFYNVGTNYDPATLKRVTVVFRILAVSTQELENTSIIGYVFDKTTGEPLPNVNVNLMGERGPYNPSGKTDKNGFYEIRCYGNYDYQIEADAPGYKWDHKFVKPLIEGPVKVDLYLEKLSEKVEYDLMKTYKGFPGGVIGVMSGNGKYVILGYRGSQGKTIYLFDVDGNLIWKKTLDDLQSVWGLNVSDDGSYTVAANLGKSTEEYAIYKDPKILLFNGKGELLWKISAPDQCREVSISHNNKYVACQGGCDVCLYELETGKLLWKQFTKGQARNIRFSNDDTSIYVGSGSDYLFKYDISGKFIWKAFIGSWPENHHSSAISKDDSYILTNGHLGEVTLIDKSGNILWAKEVGGFGAVSIAPDNSYVLVASNGPLGTAKISMDGTLLWRRSLSSGFCGMITDDSKYIVTARRDIRVMDADGNILWSYQPPLERQQRPGGRRMPQQPQFLAITPDNSKIISAYTNGSFFFFKKIIT